MPLRDKLFKIGLPLLILLIGFAVMRGLIASRTSPAKKEHTNPGLLAEVLTVHRVDRKIQVTGTGTVQSERETLITPQVSGRVVEMSPNFRVGGFFRKGELLFRIEEVDYRLAVDGARAELARAELDLAREESNARVARREWEQMGTSGTEAPNPLVLHEPQLKKARADVVSAKATLRQAELDLARTRITAPFNCRVRSEEIDLGRVVRSGSSVGVLAGTDTAEIIVPLPLDDLYWLRVPRSGGSLEGSPASVEIASGNGLAHWEGRVVRSLGEVDALGRMARIVVAVEDPYHLKKKPIPGSPDLEVGMFVQVTLEGKKLSGVIPIPRKALRRNGTVWIVDGENKLRIRKVEVVRREREDVLIQGGLQEGERIVLTALQGVAEGMKLRPQEKRGSS